MLLMSPPRPPRLRPRFVRLVHGTPQQILELLGQQLADPSRPVQGQVVGRHVQLTVPSAARHLWSPYLDLEVETVPEGAQLRGLYGPHPSVWTLVVTLYAALAFVAFIGLMFGTAQWSIGQRPIGLWITAAAAVLALIVYVVALIGQRRADTQMRELQAFLDETLG